MQKFNVLYLSAFFFLISLLSFFNIIYSYYFNLYLNVNSYLPSLVLSIILGFFLFFLKKKDIKQTLYNKILIVISGYILLPFIIALPYYFSIYNISLIDSYFESISGFTSTGFTIFENIKQLDESLIIWRSTSQWVGGLYFLFSIILLIDIFDNNLKKSLTNFLSFNSIEVTRQVFKIFVLYVALTLFIFLILKFINFRDFDALNFSLTIISSGGFKPVNEIDYILNNDLKTIIFSLTLLISFFSIFLTYNLIFLKNRYLNFFTEDFYLLIYLLIVIFIFFVLSGKNFPDLLLSITTSISNIGIFFSEFNYSFSFIFLIFVIIGGSFFSTSSGIRLFKIYTLIKFSINELVSHTKPRQVLISKVIFDKKKVDYNVINKYFLSIIIFILSLSTISILLTVSGIDFTSSIKIGILTLMNTLNSSIYGTDNFDFNSINNITKSIFIIFMIIGRVEFITLIILFKKYLFKN